MAEADLFPTNSILNEHKKKKKRHREPDEGHVEKDESDRKRRKKHREAGDPLVAESSTLDASAAVKEKKKKKKDKTERGDTSADVAEQRASDTATDALGETTSTKEKKKKRRKRESEGMTEDAGIAAEPDVQHAKDRNKQKKRQEEHPTPEDPLANSFTASFDDPSIDPPAKPKKKKKAKEQQPADASSSSLLSQHVPNDSFTAPEYITLPNNTPSLFPGLDHLPFPDLTFDGSNEDILRTLQGLDMSLMPGIPSTSSQPPAHTSGSSVSGGQISKKKKRQTALGLTQSSSTDTTAAHAEILSSKWLSTKQLAELAKSEGLVYKKGKFSAIEAKQVEDALENYKATRGLSEDSLNALIFPGDGQRKDKEFWAEITSAVPQRPLIAVYHYARRAHHPMKGQGNWKPEEDASLIQAVASLGQRWQEVSARVARPAADCRDRYRNHIVNRDKRVFGVWTSEEEAKLTQIVTEMQEGKDLDNDVFWNVVAEKMDGTRTRAQCRIKWTDSLSKKYKTEGASNARWSARDAVMLIQRVDALNVRDDTEIIWKNVSVPEWNLWSGHVMQRRWQTMKKGIKGYEDMTHSEIMDILRVKYADEPFHKAGKYKSTQFVADSDDEEVGPGSSTGPDLSRK